MRSLESSLKTLGIPFIDNLGWASGVGSDVGGFAKPSYTEEESGASQSGVDDFFSRYPALVEDGGVVDAQPMQMANDMAVMALPRWALGS